MSRRDVIVLYEADDFDQARGVVSFLHEMGYKASERVIGVSARDTHRALERIEYHLDGTRRPNTAVIILTDRMIQANNIHSFVRNIPRINEIIWLKLSPGSLDNSYLTLIADRGGHLIPYLEPSKSDRIFPYRPMLDRLLKIVANVESGPAKGAAHTTAQLIAQSEELRNEVLEMEERLARLEVHMEHVRADLSKLADVPASLATLTERVAHLPTKEELGTKLRNYLGIAGAVFAIIGVIIGVAFKFMGH